MPRADGSSKNLEPVPDAPALRKYQKAVRAAREAAGEVDRERGGEEAGPAAPPDIW